SRVASNDMVDEGRGPGRGLVMIQQLSNYLSWRQCLRELLMNCQAPDFAKRLQALRESLSSRLRIMTTADLEERRAIEDALPGLRDVEAATAKAAAAPAR